MMKKSIFLLALLALITNVSIAQSDNDQSLTKYTVAEKVLDATIICWDAAIAPTKYNAFAKDFISAPDFPKKQEGITNEKYKDIIGDYIAKLPMVVIEKILADRKKAHDELYGPRPY